MPVPVKRRSHFDAGGPKSGKEINAGAYIREYTVIIRFEKGLKVAVEFWRAIVSYYWD